MPEYSRLAKSVLNSFMTWLHSGKADITHSPTGQVQEAYICQERLKPNNGGLVVTAPCIEEVSLALPHGSAPFFKRPDLE